MCLNNLLYHSHFQIESATKHPTLLLGEEQNFVAHKDKTSNNLHPHFHRASKINQFLQTVPVTNGVELTVELMCVSQIAAFENVIVQGTPRGILRTHYEKLLQKMLTFQLHTHSSFPLTWNGDSI